jgi:hypothetical protein
MQVNNQWLAGESSDDSRDKAAGKNPLSIENIDPVTKNCASKVGSRDQTPERNQQNSQPFESGVRFKGARVTDY